MEPLNNLTVNIVYGGAFQKIKHYLKLKKNGNLVNQAPRFIQYLVLPKFYKKFIYIRMHKNDYAFFCSVS